MEVQKKETPQAKGSPTEKERAKARKIEKESRSTRAMQREKDLARKGRAKGSLLIPLVEGEGRGRTESVGPGLARLGRPPGVEAYLQKFGAS